MRKKKNKKEAKSIESLGRSRHDLLLKQLTNLNEYDLTQKALLPLFKALGYDKVDYHGGPYEEGKDIICWRSDELGQREVAAVQVKKIKPSPSASSRASFTEVVNQLQQCSEKTIPNTDGLSYRPSIVYFVTPYQIDTRALQSRFEAFASLRQVKIIDGPLLVDLLLDRLPQIVSELIGDEVDFHNVIETSLSNRDLLNALNITPDKNISSFYSDLDFGVGRITSSLFFSLKFSPKAQSVSLSEAEWRNFSKIVKSAEEYFKTPIITPNPKDVEAKFKKRNAKHLSKANTKRIKTEEGLIKKYDIDIETLSIATKKLKEKLSIDIVRSAVSRENHARYENVDPIVEEIIGHLSNIEEISEEVMLHESKNRSWDELESRINEAIEFIGNALRGKNREVKKLHQTLEDILNYIKTIRHDCLRIRKVENLIIEKANYEFKLDAPGIVSILKEKQKWLKEKITIIGKKDKKTQELYRFFSDCVQLFTVVDALYSDKLIRYSISEHADQIYCGVDSIVRTKLTMHQIFDAGVNVALLGEAGAGKTTTLQMYTKSKNIQQPSGEIVIFIPLTRLAEQKDEDWAKEDDLYKTKKIINYIYKYLVTIGVQFTEDEYQKLIKNFNRVVFVLDGIDEVIKTMPRIIEAIDGITQILPKSQIIVSSRVSGGYLDKIKFLSLTLLPFTPEQQDMFINGWFPSNISDQALNLIAHLNANPAVRNVLRNPLLATIFCVLAQHDIPLPNNEVALYKERFNLLFGHYDVHKHSKRLITHHNVLDAVSRKLAYSLHARRTRLASVNLLKEWAIEALRPSFSDEKISIAVDELIDPCNVLVPMAESAEYGFGHLRFQEYLASCELQNNRG